MSLKGKVKWFNGKKGYGFIEREDKEKDVFVHASAVRDAGLRFLNEGDEITFEVEDGEKRLVLVLSIPPVSFAGGGIPNVSGCLELIVLFGIVGCVVTCLLQVGRKRTNVIRQSGRTTHVMRP